ncbi:hypothetical protein D3C73_1211780 [compost metagenome]
MRGYPSHWAGFDRQNKVVGAAFFTSNQTNTVSDTDPNVTHRAFAHFEQGAPGHQFALVEWQGDLLAVIKDKVAGNKTVNRRPAVQLGLIRVNHHDVHQIARDPHRFGV